MSVENATTIATLNATLPADTDSLAEGSQHLRLIKAVLQATFGTAAVVPADLTAIAGKATLLTSLLGGLLSVASSVLKVTGGLLVTGGTTLTTLAVTGATSLSNVTAGVISATGLGLTGNLQVNGTINMGGPLFCGTTKVDGASVNAAAIQKNGFELVPPGCIMLWAGSPSAIPAGWHLCDGTNGTINLRNFVVAGAGGAFTNGGNPGQILMDASGTINIVSYAYIQKL